ncbi:MAG: hypothetical protein U0872_01365 [Planctomycetaceae bacterium]
MAGGYVDTARQELNYAVWAYVLMPEHIHLIVYARGRVQRVRIPSNDSKSQ